LSTIAVVLLIVGALAFAFALEDGAAARAWEAFLVNLFFWLGIAQGGVIISCAFYLTNGRWAGRTHYRLAEAFSGFIPLGFVLFCALYFGRNEIFPWVHQELPATRALWLNTP